MTNPALFLSLSLLLTGCAHKYYPANNTIALVTRADFRAASERTPDFVAHCVRTITDLEIKLNAENEARERERSLPCPVCARKAREATVKKLKLEQASPPLPPIE